MKHSMKANLLALWVMLAMGLVICARADSVRLNNGTVLEGEILSEDDIQMVIEVALAGGTILKRETIKKAEIAQIKRLTLEQKAERAMEAAFKDLQRYQLDPSTSRAVSYYDQVITEVLRK